MAPKNPGLRAVAHSAALQAAKGTSAPASEAAEVKEEIVGIGIRMPKSMHRELRRISYEEEISMNSLLIEGVQHVIKTHPKKG
jgi:hypothetical protein